MLHGEISWKNHTYSHSAFRFTSASFQPIVIPDSYYIFQSQGYSLGTRQSPMTSTMKKKDIGAWKHPHHVFICWDMVRNSPEYVSVSAHSNGLYETIFVYGADELPTLESWGTRDTLAVWLVTHTIRVNCSLTLCLWTVFRNSGVCLVWVYKGPRIVGAHHGLRWVQHNLLVNASPSRSNFLSRHYSLGIFESYMLSPSLPLSISLFSVLSVSSEMHGLLRQNSIE